MVLTRTMLKKERSTTDISDSGSEASEGEVVKLKNEIGRLKKELKEERRKRNAGGNRSQAQEIKRLKEQHARDKVRITSYKKQLVAKEIEADAKELVKDDVPSSEAPAHSDLMKTLLRRFCDLMAVTTMEEKSDCPICLDTRIFSEFSGFPCEHCVCNTCLPSLPLEEGKVSCPTCRRLSSYEEHEQVAYTELGRWDALLEVAKEWAKVDTKDADDSTDDEEKISLDESEDNESDNNRPDIVNTAQGQVVEDASQEPPGGPIIRAATPSSEPAHYSQLTPQQKKKRMEEIVRERRQKRRQ